MLLFIPKPGILLILCPILIKRHLVVHLGTIFGQITLFLHPLGTKTASFWICLTRQSMEEPLLTNRRFSFGRQTVKTRENTLASWRTRLGRLTWTTSLCWTSITNPGSSYGCLQTHQSASWTNRTSLSTVTSFPAIRPLWPVSNGSWKESSWSNCLCVTMTFTTTSLGPKTTKIRSFPPTCATSTPVYWCLNTSQKSSTEIFPVRGQMKPDGAQDQLNHRWKFTVSIF